MCKLLPEEIVRQTLILRMINELGYPKACISVEKGLRSMPHLKGQKVPDRRFDIICFSTNLHPEHILFPLLLIECKAHRFNRETFSQVIGYNFYVQAPFISVANQYEVVTGCKLQDGGYEFITGVPPYGELVEKAKKIYGSKDSQESPTLVD